MSLEFFANKISKIKGVGEKTSKNLSRLFNGLEAPEANFRDALFHLPYNVIRRQNNVKLLFLENGANIIATVTVENVEEKRIRGRAIYNIICRNDSGYLTLVFFNAFADYIKTNFKVGKKIAVSGVVERFNNALQIAHPDYVVADESFIPLCEPVYPLTYGVNNKMLYRTIKNLLSQMPKLEEWADNEYIKQNRFLSFNDSLQKLHHLNSLDDLAIDNVYRRRLAFDEILANQLALAISRKSVAKQAGNKIITNKNHYNQFTKNLPFSLTEDQRSVINEIFSDFKSGNRMFRLLQGDVGSGKTAVAIATMIDAVEAGFQTAFMLPTEILAQQQYESIKQVLQNNYFKNLNIECCLITGSTKKAEKARLLEEIKQNRIQIVIGTHSLFQEAVGFANLGYIVIDEQHRFGVKQRLELSQKGDATHVLLMSATPIPRTLAMTIYGDLEVSSIHQKPAGRKKIDTRTISKERADDVIERIKVAIEKDNRVYWVCPLVKLNEELPLEEQNLNASAEERYKTLKPIFGDAIRIVHGQMKPKEKDAAIEDFRSGKAKVLVSTTVIEVGVNVPEATIIIIENAEKFGLAQLHQLRGRVGRSDRDSSCILLYGEKLGETSRKRLQILRETDDGFKIAEEDLILRGSGDIVGTKQSGLPEYKFALLPEHKDLLFAARDYVKIILNKDPGLSSEIGKNLRILLKLFDYDKQIKDFVI
jgi:ATP-dependent DNA helicase RecG